MPDVLHVVIIFHDVDELLHQLDMLFVIQLLIVLRYHLDLSGDEGVLLAKFLGNGIEIVGSGVDGEHIAVGLKIVSAAVHGVHHDVIFLVVAVLIVDDQDTLLVEAPGHAAGSAQVAAELIEVVAHGACGTVAVVGHGLHDDSNTAGAVAFVGDGLVVITTACTGGLLQAALDVVVVSSVNCLFVIN